MGWVRTLSAPPSPTWEPPAVAAREYDGPPARALAAELDLRWTHRVTVLHGAAGRGKSVAVARALDAHLHHPVGLDVWLSCGPFDADAEHLGRAILDALARHRAEHHAAPVDGPGGRGAVVTPGAPDGSWAVADTATSADPESLSAAISNAIWALAPVEVCLTLDETHRLPSDSTGLGLLRDLVRALPTNGHLLVVARTLASVPFTARLGDGDALVVDSALLPSAPTMPAVESLSPEQVDALALLRSVGPMDDATAGRLLDHRVRLDRLFAGLPYVVRSGGHHAVHEAWDDLLAAAHPADLDGSTDSPGRVGLADVAPLARRATAWQTAAIALARESGDLARAFHLAAAVGSWPAAVEVLADACRTMLYRTDVHRVDRWLVLLPDVWRQEPVVRLAEALTDLTLQDGALRGRLQDAADALERTGQTDLELVALARLCVLAWRAGDQDGFDTHRARMGRIAAAGDRDAAQLSALGRLMHAEAAGDAATMWRLLEELSGKGLDGPMRAMLVRYRAVVELQYGAPERVLTLTASAGSDVVVRELRYEMVVTRAWAQWFLGRVDDAIMTVEALRGAGHDEMTDGAVGASTELMRALLGHQSPGPRSTAEALEAAAGRARAQGMIGPQAAYAMAAAARLVNDGEEDEAREVLRHALTGPSGGPRTASVTVRAVCLPYVLLGELPPGLAEGDLGDGPRTGLVAARALATMRQGHRGGIALASVVLKDPDLTPTHLPPVWAIELALRAGQDVDRVVAAAGPAGPRALEVLARSSVPRLRDAARRAQHRLQRAPSGRYVVRLLGPVRVEHDGCPVEHPDWRRERVRALLVLLVRRTVISRAEACDRLWPDLDAGAASNNLRVTLSYLHRALDGAGPDVGGRGVVQADAGSLGLSRPEAWTLDVVELDRLLDQAERADDAGDLPHAIALMREALGWYRGPYLADLRASATDELEGDRVRSRVVRAMVRLGALLAAAGDLAEAQRYAVRALEVDPWSEHAAALEISTYLARGDRPAAERAYRRCRDTLAELDLEPSDVIGRVVHRLRQGPHPRPTLTR